MSESTQTNIPRPPQQGKRPSNSVWRGNKYPAVKLRGYYSDVASQENMDKIGVRLLGKKNYLFFNYNVFLKGDLCWTRFA
jgi:hypothetical protein